MIPQLGVDKLLADEERLRSLSKKRVAILSNQNALSASYKVSANAIREKCGTSLKALISPEHGWSGFKPEGESITHGHDPDLDLPIISLYGDGRTGLSALEEMKIDTIIIDLQDVGLRCYTYGITCAQIIDKFEGSSLEILVCDRPNPLGPEQKGPKLEKDLRSFVGHFNIPFQHGQTLGSILSEYCQNKTIDFSIISCEPYHKPYQYPWIPPSPNLPSWDSVLLYPALVMLEGTNISEGRGTTLPFTSFGAPNLNHNEIVDLVNSNGHLGVKARPIHFTPTSGKLAGVSCLGVHLLIPDYRSLDAYSLGLALLDYLCGSYDKFEWTPLMDKEKDIYFIDYLLGTREIRKKITLAQMKEKTYTFRK